jgi:serine/threonine protein kinase/Tol biopolymer transport system component
MALEPGARIGPYEVIALIGAGGMGKVWRARHTTLKRDDALKVLPDAFASNADRLARFQREAQVLASLNHPNIAHLYGLEHVDGMQALVMELVEGPTLADRIVQGPIPVDEALPIAMQIAEALEAAHEQGIIHRDLKPANVKVRHDGTVKVLDFGLAKALEPVSAGNPNATASPTITSPSMLTGAGILLGTAAYMSPEQARGKAVDRRSDIWAFGCVLYEMLTARPAFDADDVSGTLARVLEREVDLDALPRSVPARVRQVLRVCLQKDPKQRVRDIRDVRLALEGAFDAPSIQSAAPTTGSVVTHLRPWSLILAIAATLAAVLVSGGIAWILKPAPGQPAQPIRRFTVATAPSAPLAIAVNSRDLAVTPDGTRLVYFAGEDGNRRLYVRAFDEIDATPIRQGERFFEPFVSPDSRWVGFQDESDFTLKKVPISGGPPVAIVSVGTEILGASWGPDDTVVFARSDGTGLWTVPGTGGNAKALTTLKKERTEVSHRWPEFLPGGKAVLFTIVSGQHADGFQIAVVNLETMEQKILVPLGSSPRFSVTGHLVFVVEGALQAVPFDPARLEVLGDPIPVLEGVISKASGAADFSLSRDGSLVYVPSSGQSAARTLVWVDRQGHEEPINAPTRAYVYPRLSPDGTRVALDVRDQESDLWIWNLARQTFTRLTLDPTIDRVPVWTADGRLLFSSNRDGTANLFWQAVDATGAAERLTRSPNEQFATSTSPDGAFAVFSDATTRDLMMLALNGDRGVRPLVQSRFIEENGEISADGRWLAYESNQSGQPEIYVRPFPDVGSGLSQVSAEGGTRPLWARSGRELFYVGLTGALMSVPFQPGSGEAAGTPTKVLEGGQYFVGSAQNTHRTYDVSLDGQRFLMLKEAAADQGDARPPIIVVQNWHEELKRLVPAR